MSSLGARESGGTPPALAARVREALARHGRHSGDGTADGAAAFALRHLAAGEGLLRDVLRADCRSRETALDLLAADALVTRAFELLAAHPESLDAHAEDAMRRVAALVAEARRGDEGGTPAPPPSSDLSSGPA